MSTSLSTIGEIKTEFLVRHNSATTISYFTDTILQNWIDQAHKYATSYKKWPFTEGRSSTSYASLTTDEDGATYGLYPEGWKLKAIRLLQIGGKTYDKRDFIGFRKFLDTFPSATDKIWTDYGLRYYINAGAQGSGTVSVFGQYVPALDLTDLSAATVFSGIDENGNLAIVELMQSYAMTKEKKEDEAKVHLEKAQILLEGVWRQFTDEGFNYKTSDSDGMFKRVDVVRGALRDDLFKRDQFT